MKAGAGTVVNVSSLLATVIERKWFTIEANGSSASSMACIRAIASTLER